MGSRDKRREVLVKAQPMLTAGSQTQEQGQRVGRLGAPGKDDAAARYATNLKTESRFALLRENLGRN